MDEESRLLIYWDFIWFPLLQCKTYDDGHGDDNDDDNGEYDKDKLS